MGGFGSGRSGRWRVSRRPLAESMRSIDLATCPLGAVITYSAHPPHSQAHRDFAALRLTRDAFAVRERLGDPRAVPGFRCTFLPDMPSSMTSGSSIIVSVQNTDVDMAFVMDQRTRHSQ